MKVTPGKPLQGDFNSPLYNYLQNNYIHIFSINNLKIAKFFD